MHEFTEKILSAISVETHTELKAALRRFNTHHPDRKASVADMLAEMTDQALHVFGLEIQDMPAQDFESPKMRAFTILFIQECARRMNTPCFILTIERKEI